MSVRTYEVVIRARDMGFHYEWVVLDVNRHVKARGGANCRWFARWSAKRAVKRLVHADADGVVERYKLRRAQ